MRSRAVACLPLLALSAAAFGGAPLNLTATCRLCLDGPWDFKPVYESQLGPPPSEGFAADAITVPSVWNRYPPHYGGDWGAYDNFPSYPQEWSKARRGWYRKRVEVPTDWDGGRVFLRCGGVLHNAVVCVGGAEVGRHVGGFSPFEVDITEYAKPGASVELSIGVSEADREKGLLLSPSGSWWGWERLGIWQSVHLVRRPAVYVSDAFIVTSTRKGRIDLRVSVANASSEPFDGEVAVRVRDKGKDEVRLMLPGAGVSVPAGGDTTVDLGSDWAAPVTWSAEQPHLYEAEIALSRGSEEVHTETETFGFREIWIEGTRFYLNGEPIRFRGDSWHYMGSCMQNRAYARAWLSMMLDQGLNIVRLHAMPHPPFFLELADEMGVYVVGESPVYGSGGNLALSSDEFWRRAEDACRAMVRRDRNHPSVLFWSACNEITWKGGAESVEPLLRLGEAIDEEDGNRPVWYDGDYDLGGPAEVMAGHYGDGWVTWDAHWRGDKPWVMGEYGQFFYGGPEEAAAWGGEAPYGSFSARLRAAAAECARYTLDFRYHGAASITPWDFVWYALEPLELGDGLGVGPPALPAGPDQMRPERIGAGSVTLNPGYDAALPAYRPNPAFPILRDAFAPIALDVREKDRAHFGGASLRRTVVVFSDLPQASSYALRWTLQTEAGDGPEGSARLDVERYGQREIEIELALPGVTAETKAHLALSLSRGKDVVCQSLYPLLLRPRPKPGSGSAVRVALYDPNGLVGDLFAGVASASRVSALEDLLSSGAELAVLGPRLDEGDLPSLCRVSRDLTEFVRGGGALLILDQSLPLPWLPTRLPLAAQGLSRCFVRTPGHPVLRGIDQMEMADWPSGMCDRAFVKPDRGCFRVLLDGGQGLGLTPLVEIKLGKGLVIASQLKLSAESPTARRLLRNGLEYLASAKAAPGAASVLADADGSLRTALSRVGLTDAGGRARVVIADGTSASACGRLAELLRQGRSGLDAAVVVNLTPESAGALGEVLPAGLRVEAADAVSQLVKTGVPTGVLAGVSDSDLYWTGGRSPQRIIDHGLFVESPDYEILTQQAPIDWAGWYGRYSAEQIKVAAIRRSEARLGRSRLPAGLLRTSVDDVALYVWQLRLDGLPERRDRLLSQVLTNLGVSLEPPTGERRAVVDVGDPVSDMMHLGSGWAEPKGAAAPPSSVPVYGGSGNCRRVSGERGLLFLNLEPGTDYELACVADCPEGGSAAVLANGRPLGAVSHRGMGLTRLGLPADALPSTGLCMIEIVPESVPVDLCALDARPSDSPDGWASERGYIRSWLVCGPFDMSGHDMDFDFMDGEAGVCPREGEASAAGEWRAYYSTSDVVDLRSRALFGPKERSAAYAFCYVWSPYDERALLASPEVGDVNLLIGSDDGVKVWLNGRQVWRNDVTRPISPDSDRIGGLTLRPGWNDLLVKVTQGIGEWQLSARFARGSGAPMPELGYSLVGGR